MQTFIDTSTQKVYAFNDDVTVTDSGGIYSFATAAGMLLKLPTTLQPYTVPAPTAAQLLAQAKAAQIAIITQACAAAITSGFASSALGRAHTYPSSPTDQTNLVTHVMSSLLPGLPSTWATPYPCCDANGVWGSKEHTASQIQQVGADWKAFLSSCLLKKRALEDKIKLAKTVGKVQALAW